MRKLSIDELASSMAKVGALDVDEEKLKIEVEKLLSAFLEGEGVKIDPSYEYTFISGDRADALYGHVIIEYEKPGALSVHAKRKHAIGQVKKYIRQVAKEAEDYHRFFGVALDGRQIIFVRYISSNKIWSVSKLAQVNTSTVSRLVQAIGALSKKPLDTTFMVQDFGPTGKIAVPFVKLLYDVRLTTKRAQTLYEDWRRVFQQVAGYSVPAMKGLERLYPVDKDVDYEKLLFSIHTYYSLLMKLIAAELVVLYCGGRVAESYWDSLLAAEAQGRLKERLDEVESGSLFERLDYLKNFVEGDYFSWYLDEWSERVHEQVLGLIKAVSDYVVGTGDLEPERMRDLFKSLYQNLVPREVRISPESREITLQSIRQSC